MGVDVHNARKEQRLKSDMERQLNKDNSAIMLK